MLTLMSGLLRPQAPGVDSAAPYIKEHAGDNPATSCWTLFMRHTLALSYPGGQAAPCTCLSGLLCCLGCSGLSLLPCLLLLSRAVGVRDALKRQLHLGAPVDSVQWVFPEPAQAQTGSSTAIAPAQLCGDPGLWADALQRKHLLTL